MRVKHDIAYQERKAKWFKEHPETEYLSDEFVCDTKNITFDEWGWYFVSRINNTSAKRYQELKHPRRGWGHLSNVHGVEDPCIEGCRFYPEEGEVSALEILEDYKDYQGYDEVRSKWEELDNQENEG
jgi:hypothetical protein